MIFFGDRTRRVDFAKAVVFFPPMNTDLLGSKELLLQNNPYPSYWQGQMAPG